MRNCTCIEFKQSYYTKTQFLQIIYNELLYFLMYKLGRAFGKTFKLVLNETTKTYSFHKFLLAFVKITLSNNKQKSITKFLIFVMFMLA